MKNSNLWESPLYDTLPDKRIYMLILLLVISFALGFCEIFIYSFQSIAFKIDLDS